ncbi:HNH endonuclease [Streptomyces sp. NPDC055006]
MYAQEQRRRARLARAPHTPYSRADLFDRWGYTCCYCDAPATDVEHIKPISKGGADALHNLTIACSPCNSSKGAKTLAEWALTWLA